MKYYSGTCCKCKKKKKIDKQINNPCLTVLLLPQDLKADVHHKDSSGSEEGSKCEAAAAAAAATAVSTPRDLQESSRSDKRMRGEANTLLQLCLVHNPTYIYWWFKFKFFYEIIVK